MSALFHVVVVRRFPAGHLNAGTRYDDHEIVMTSYPVPHEVALVIARKHTPYRASRSRFWTNAEPKLAPERRPRALP